MPDITDHAQNLIDYDKNHPCLAMFTHDYKNQVMVCGELRFGSLKIAYTNIDHVV